MYKLTRIALGAASCFMLFGGTAAAQTSITNTGPGSNNTVTQTSTNNCTVTNNNTVTATNSNPQSSTSGTANTSGNTSGGSATSGSSSNTSNNSTNAFINNLNGCAPAAATAAAVTTSQPQVQSAATTGGQGAAEVMAAQVSAPVGAVSAGAPNDAALLLGLSSSTLLTGSVAAFRIRKFYN